MDDQHIVIFDNMIKNPKLYDFLATMAKSKKSSIVLKCLEIVENFTKYYIQW